MTNLSQCRPGRLMLERSVFPRPEGWLAAAVWNTEAEQVCGAMTSHA